MGGDSPAPDTNMSPVVFGTVSCSPPGCLDDPEMGNVQSLTETTGRALASPNRDRNRFSRTSGLERSKQQDHDALELEAQCDERDRILQKSNVSPEKTRQPENRPMAVMMLVAGHALSASLLLVVNKRALHVFPFVWVLTTLQFLPTALLVGLAGFLGFADVDRLEPRKLVAFFPAAGMFFITLTAGNAVVKHSNVDTFIVMRSLVPIPCAFLETFALGEPCPRLTSWLCLASLVIGASLYASLNAGIAMRSFSWICLFLTMMPVDAVLIKHAINTSGLSSTWSLVLYQNAIAATLGIVCVIIMEPASLTALAQVVWKSDGVMDWLSLWPLAVSVVLGVSVSFFQMSVRQVVSSTLFMVIGVANKLLAVLMNQMFLEANGSLGSLVSVLLSIASALGFQQTVKGKGISQAPKEKPKGGSSGSSTKGLMHSYIAMAVGLIWASVLTLRDTS